MEPQAVSEAAVEEPTQAITEPAVAEQPPVEVEETPAPAPVEIQPAPVPAVAEALPPAPVLPPAVVQPAQLVSPGEAQQALENGELDTALIYYDKVIRSGEKLEDTIHELRQALYRYPVEISLWQTLGDAYLRSNCLQEALDAYTKAEELLR